MKIVLYDTIQTWRLEHDLTIVSELLPPPQILVVLLMGEIQMIRRLTECIFVNSYSASTMSVVIYLTGVFFYCAQGISLVCLMQEKTLTLSKYLGYIFYN